MTVVRRYDAVLLDAGETILHPHPSFVELLAILLERIGFPIDASSPEPLERAFSHAMLATVDTGEPFSISPEHSRRFWGGLYARLLADLGIHDPGGEIVEYLYGQFSKPEHYELFPDALPAIRELRASGYRVGLISNFEAWLAKLLDRLGVSPLLEVAVISGVEGIEKPDLRIFETALDRLGLPPERAVYVGDNPRVDVDPAEKLGMSAVLIDRHDRHPHRPRIRSLEELVAVIA